MWTKITVRLKFEKGAFRNCIVHEAYLKKGEMEMCIKLLVRVSEDERPFGILGGRICHRLD